MRVGDAAGESGTFDVVVVGAGILGLAVARAILLRNPDLRLTVLEKEDEIAAHQTGRNSGVIHSGIYYAPGSLKARLCVEGSRLLYEYCDTNSIPYERCGKVIIATTRAELPRLAELHGRASANGVPGVREVDQTQLRELEPRANGIRALHAPTTGIVDFRRVAAAFARDIERSGGTIRTRVEVTHIRQAARRTILTTPDREFATRGLVTCAGLYSDRLARMTGAARDPRIVPFRGSYYQLTPERLGLVRSLVYPVPNPAFPFLGVHFTKRISGDVWAGPNAVLAFHREGYTVRDVDVRDVWEVLGYRGFRALARRYWAVGAAELWGELSKRAFVRALQQLVPDVSADDLVRGPSGVRAQALAADGRLLDDFWLDEGERVVHVRNAPSPGATSSLAIAQVIAEASLKRFALTRT